MSEIVTTAPLPATTIDLLRRADAELLASQFSSGSDERFVHAHLAALRAAAAVLAARGGSSRPRGARTVWELVVAAAPETEPWAAYFASGARVRQAIEAGRTDVAGVDRAEEVLCAAEDFLDAVRALLEPPSERAVGGPVDSRSTARDAHRNQLFSARAS